ncbi:MATE family efflux transporter [Mucilaginibacter sp. 14171R-50]|uniref:MATE family efflux transporter n=1 Tax=Mucilaginibacter sp. 14171R-50 TaxID=2703789 RepID=UPI00138CAEF1|nr:MATE family efflux transporter [Mucilaginibacter sp. 14171R-50]QHS57140.1 MATE family efflux transporter [Mucilaginibacter sp. 14171R-50]
MKALYQKYQFYYRDSLKLAIPVVISQLGHTLVQVSDSVIVGHFAGTTALAAVSLVNSLFLVPLVIGVGISYGITPLIAQNNGRGNYQECGTLLSNSFFLNVITGIVLFCAIYFGVMLFINKLHQSPDVVIQAKPYLFLLSISLIPLLVFSTFKQFAEGLGFTKQAMLISIWGNVLNIVLGVIFVKGLFGVHPMGIKGVGYSTLIDRSVMAIVMAVYVLRSPIFKKYLKDFAVRNIDRMRGLQILKIGMPVAMQYVFEVGAFGGAALIIGSIGMVEQAAHQVAISLAAMTYMMASGISAAAAIRSGNYFGAGNHSELRLSAISNYHIVIVFMSCTAIIFTLFNQYLPWIYTTDRTVIAIAAQLLIVAAFFQLFDGTQVVGLGILRGMGDVNKPTLITFISYWIVGLPMAYLLGIYFDLGVTGVWYGLVLGLMAASIMLFLRFQSISKSNNLIIVDDISQQIKNTYH